MSSRAALSERLHLDPAAPTKTFVLDVHVDADASPDAFLAGVVGDGAVEPTEDAFLFRVPLDDGELWVDQLDERFWSFHTDLPAATAQRWLHERVEARRDLDWMWLPSEHLRNAWPGATPTQVRTDFAGQGFLGGDSAASRLRLQATGTDSDQLLDYLARDERYRSAVSLGGIQLMVGDADLGRLTEAVNRRGRFAASGESLELHMQFVRRVVSHYSAFVSMVEQRALGCDPLPEAGDAGGGTLAGAPVLVQFSRAVPDMTRFLEELLAVRLPFRLWGVPQVVDGVAEVDAVDLHVGQRLRLDVSSTWMRVYLERGACGNTVARLLSNLQHGFDSALTLADPDLQRCFEARTGNASLP